MPILETIRPSDSFLPPFRRTAAESEGRDIRGPLIRPEEMYMINSRPMSKEQEIYSDPVGRALSGSKAGCAYLASTIPRFLRRGGQGRVFLRPRCLPAEYPDQKLIMIPPPFEPKRGLTRWLSTEPNV
jgi:hypothetical protein